MAFFEAVSKSLGKFSESNRILTVVVKITTIIIWDPPLKTKTVYFIYILVYIYIYIYI